MTRYFIIPGLGNSGPDHWQTHFEKSSDNFIRINQREWDAPDCDEWITTIDNALAGINPADVVLIGHSLGCTAIAHWARRYRKKIKGALLVAPSDIEAPVYTFQSTGFLPIPLEKINFRTIIVTSTNDQWVSVMRATQFASAWGSELITIGDAGHINTDSGHGLWPEGFDILKTL